MKEEQLWLRSDCECCVSLGMDSYELRLLLSNGCYSCFGEPLDLFVGCICLVLQVGLNYWAFSCSVLKVTFTGLCI